MTARLASVLWRSRNPIADMPPDVWARVQAEKPEARDVPVRFPQWGHLAFRVFWLADTERPRGWGHYPIPVSKVREWCRAEAPDAASARTLELVVRAMDRRFLEIEIARAEAERKANGGK